jgi:hypothetical protein
VEQIKIENGKGSIVVSNLRCIDFKKGLGYHVAFDIEANSPDFTLNTNFSEVLVLQFDGNRIVDENFQLKELIFNRDEIKLKISPCEDTDLIGAFAEISLVAGADKIADFKIELKAYANVVCGR